VSNDTPAAASLDDYQWLVGSDAAKWFEIADSLAAEPKSTLVRLVERMRTELSPPRAHLILQQRELREKAREKFPQADKMFFTPRGLEQSTDAAVAAHKAGRFPQQAPLGDLCCGIGGDSTALAGRGAVLAVDRDPVAMILAKANIKALSGRVSEDDSFQCASIEDFVVHITQASAWHIDPDRRPSGRRTTKVMLHEPAPEVLQRLLSLNPQGAIKLAPAADLEEAWWQEAELEWISRRRQCRQLVAWFGGLVEHPGRRRATVLRNTPDFSPQVAATFVGEPNVDIAVASRIGRYVYEPDAAVLAAKLEGALAHHRELRAIASGIAYFTGDEPISDGAFDGFEVMEILPYDARSVKQWLAARDIGRLEIKKRGVPLEPEKVRRELANNGTDAATVLLAKISGRVKAIVARRMEK